MADRHAPDEKPVRTGRQRHPAETGHAASPRAASTPLKHQGRER
jgi:hypothetical protein